MIPVSASPAVEVTFMGYLFGYSVKAKVVLFSAVDNSPASPLLPLTRHQSAILLLMAKRWEMMPVILRACHTARFGDFYAILLQCFNHPAFGSPQLIGYLGGGKPVGDPLFKLRLDAF